MKYRSVTVEAPATTANLGPAFDAMGVALDIWNWLTMEAGGESRVEVEGQGSGELPKGRENVVYAAALRLFREAGVEAPPLRIRCRNKIPLKRGLGSSSAAIVGGLVGANALLGNPVSQERMLALAVEMEGHPDNVTPALLGGAQIVVTDGNKLVTSPVRMPTDLKVVLYVPNGTISTAEARKALPKQVSREDAVFNLGRAALLVNALASDRPQDLRAATEDRLHQPYREHLFPAMKVIIRDALKAGALGAFVSGSGPTVLALARGREMSIAYEMAEGARKANAPGETVITRPTEKGAHIIEAA
ncbi:MAG: homoserine kinase [SAR202 cluster bacterium]|nr:homoserine kinase [SAR202 cluster bacterium]